MQAALACTLALLGPASGCDTASGTTAVDTPPQPQPQLVAQPGNIGWMILFTGFSAQPDHLSVRVGDEADYRPLHGTAFTLPSNAEATEISIRYSIAGREHGPTSFQFDPKAAQLDFSKRALDMLSPAFVEWQHNGGASLVAFTTLAMHTCALERVEYGFFGTPDHEWTLPACKGPGARLDGGNLFVPTPAGAESLSVRVTFLDGEQLNVQLQEAS